MSTSTKVAIISIALIPFYSACWYYSGWITSIVLCAVAAAGMFWAWGDV